MNISLRLQQLSTLSLGDWLLIVMIVSLKSYTMLYQRLPMQDSTIKACLFGECFMRVILKNVIDIISFKMLHLLQS